MPRPARERRGPRISVLRLGHRPGRDPRLTTHVALVARAWGADRLYLEPPDDALAARLAAVNARWGGAFEIVGAPAWKPIVRAFDGAVVHLTMYGEPLDRVVPRLRRRARLLVVVGGAKVPADLYRLATVNVAVGPQPHSEVAALAVLLDRLRGSPSPRQRPAGQLAITPSARGKRVRVRGRTRP